MPTMKLKKHVLDDLGRINNEEFKNVKKSPIIVVLDNIRSLQNVGSFFRTGDAFRIEKLVLCGITGTPPNREIEKTALGATKSVEFEHYADTISAIEVYKNNGWIIVSMEQTNKSIELQNFKPQTDTKYCFVFGNEVFGVSEPVLENSDIIIEIPQFGTKHSFNVSVSAGIVLWDFYLKNKLNFLSKPS
jgi:23S rRNA (guanosine2251-2'-O)-methyltransferase